MSCSASVAQYFLWMSEYWQWFAHLTYDSLNSIAVTLGRIRYTSSNAHQGTSDIELMTVALSSSYESHICNRFVGLIAVATTIKAWWMGWSGNESSAWTGYIRERVHICIQEDSIHGLHLYMGVFVGIKALQNGAPHDPMLWVMEFRSKVLGQKKVRRRSCGGLNRSSAAWTWKLNRVRSACRENASKWATCVWSMPRGVAFVLLDGIGDVTIPDLGRLTPLQAADTPTLDAIAGVWIWYYAIAKAIV